MRRIAKILLAAGISFTAFTAVGLADPFLMSPTIDAAVRSFQGGDFRVARLKPSGAGDLQAEAAADLNSPEVKKLQEAIRSNKMLMDNLEAQNVEINNIVSAEVADNGGLILLVR